MNSKFSKKCFPLFISYLHFVKPVSSKFIFWQTTLAQTVVLIFDLDCHTFDSFFNGPTELKPHHGDDN